MSRRRELIVTNLLALVVLLAALAAGWWDAALFGLGVLVFMDVLVLLREFMGRSDRGGEE
jgi:hypothetical protein